MKKYYENEHGFIVNDDCLNMMRELDADSIDLTVTSPPYDNLRNYRGYVFNFEGVARELFRVTKDGGIVVWVVGDATINGSETGTSFRQALYFIDCGFKLHDTMIYEKNSSAFPAAKGSKRYTQIFEYMFVFSKGTTKTIHLIYDKPNKSFGQDKSGVGRRKATGEHKIEQRKPSKEFSRRNNWWYIPPQKGAGHPAVFPEQLANDHIISWSNEGDIVLDPFSGSGTTHKMALLNNRRFIGFEISQEYIDIETQRLKDCGLWRYDY